MKEEMDFVPVVPPRSDRREPSAYDRAACRRRNEAERLFGCSRAFAASIPATTRRTDTLDVMY